MHNDYQPNYLSHHGILGQKWGVKHGPPYPLDSANKSQSEKEKSHLSDKQKKYIAIGAAVATTALATYGVYKFGGPKAAVSKLSKLVSSGKNSSKPYMKMNLQFFAKRKHSPNKFHKINFPNAPKGSNPSKAIREAVHWKQDKVIKGEIFTHRYGNFGYIMKGDGEGYTAEILDIFPIPDADTGLLKRNPYVK